MFWGFIYRSDKTGDATAKAYLEGGTEPPQDEADKLARKDERAAALECVQDRPDGVLVGKRVAL